MAGQSRSRGSPLNTRAVAWVPHLEPTRNGLVAGHIETQVRSPWERALSPAAFAGSLDDLLAGLIGELGAGGWPLASS